MSEVDQGRKDKEAARKLPTVNGASVWYFRLGHDSATRIGVIGHKGKEVRGRLDRFILGITTALRGF